MTYRPRNAYYLRISTDIVLPLFLYLDERHINWMSDVILQHVLADLRPLIIPKLQAEKDVHFGPGALPGNKRGTVEVHRGETYQFAYFFRKFEPHTVLFKSRCFVTAPLHPEAGPEPVSLRHAGQSSQRKTSRDRRSGKQCKRKRVKSVGEDKITQRYVDEDQWPAEESEEDVGVTNSIVGEPRPARKQRRITPDAHQEGDINTESVRRNIAMNFPFLETGGSSRDPGTPTIEDRDAIRWDAIDQPDLSPHTTDIELAVEEEEEKPKPLLKLRYQSLPIAGHCLCVVVEPWPPLRTETTLQSMGLGTLFQRGNLEPSLLPSNGPVIAGERAKTPLFLPDYDMASNEAPFRVGRNLPPVPLFHDVMSTAEDDDYNDSDGLINFSQTLNAAGHMHTITADEDDDMDGAVLFGDADEVRELF